LYSCGNHCLPKMDRNERWLVGVDSMRSSNGFSATSCDFQKERPLIRRSMSFPSISLRNLEPDRPSVKRSLSDQPSVKISLSDAAAFKNSRGTNEETSKRRLQQLPYDSTVPVVYFLDSLQDSIRETQNVQQRRAIMSQVLESALQMVDTEPNDEG
jgi:hypothetical protein